MLEEMITALEETTGELVPALTDDLESVGEIRQLILQLALWTPDVKTRLNRIARQIKRVRSYSSLLEGLIIALRNSLAAIPSAMDNNCVLCLKPVDEAHPGRDIGGGRYVHDACMG